MSFCVDLVSEDSFYENITLGVTKLLEADRRVCNVTVERRAPCDRVALGSWEQRHSVALPEDLSNFYSSTDGFLLTWQYKFSADEILPVGRISVNPLSELYLTPALKELVDLAQSRPSANQRRPGLNYRSKVLDLDNCRAMGKVCLVFAEGDWSVWLVTRAGWCWLADSFTRYLRMSLVHLGLPSWQAVFSSAPVLPWAEQLFYLLAPHLLERETDASAGGEPADVFNQIDPAVFKNTLKHHARGVANRANQ